MMPRTGGQPVRPHGIGYRADIDGLRAVAVLAVLLFHAGVPGFAGGFVGVDVFFVISGFLITSIIAGQLETGRFSIAEFYARRVRRIFPALFATLLATGLVASFFFLPRDFQSFGASVVAMTAFASNILFWRQDDYFDAPAEFKPLLHTWSLCIEEQFYLVFPLLLAALWHLRPQIRWRLLAGLALVSFALGLWATQKEPQAAFYLLPTRAWELLAGSLLALRAPSRTRIPPAAAWAAGWAGLAMVAVSIAVFDETTPFPGTAALMPVIGAVLVIWAGAEHRAGASSLLASPPSVFVGRISFSLYLWHWPVIVLLRYALARDLEMPEIVIVLVLSFLLAVLSWKYVEQPFRRPGRLPNVAVLKFAAATMAGFMLAGAGLLATGGLPQRLPERLLAYGQAEEQPEDMEHLHCDDWAARRTNLSGICLVGDLSAAQPSFAVIGDSHAEALLPAFDLASTRNREKGLVFIRHACRPALGVMHVSDGERNAGCASFVDKAITEIRAQASIKEVVFAARWSRQVLGTGYQQANSYYADALSPEVSLRENKLSLIRGLDRAFDALSGRRITVVGMVPENEFLPPMALAMADLFRRAPPRTSTAAFQRRNAPVEEVFGELAKWHTFEVISPARRLCDETSCLAEIDGRPLYRDDDHLSAFGAEQLAFVMDGIFDDQGPLAGDGPAGRGPNLPLNRDPGPSARRVPWRRGSVRARTSARCRRPASR